MTLAESVDLKTKLVPVPQNTRTLPDPFHARTGHTLPEEQSAVYKQLKETQKYASENGMRINFKKTKFMLFNNCKKWDFFPEYKANDLELELVEEMKVLGVVVRSDMKWSSNTKYIVDKAYRRLWILRRLKYHGAGTKDLIDVYQKQVRSVLELAVPAWHPGLTLAESIDIERVQKAALHIILGDKYSDYHTALVDTQLESLATRRENLCLKFSIKALRNKKHQNWFKLNQGTRDTRTSKPYLCPVVTRTRRFEKSPISFMTTLLNKHLSKK